VAFGFLCETTFGFFFFFTTFFGVSAFVFTGAVSVAVTFDPDGGVPVAVATLLKFARTFGRVHVYVTVAPGAIEAKAGMSAFVRLQFGDSGSVTVTSVSTVLPVFVTVIENVAVPPTGTVCDLGFFTIAMLGAGAGVTVKGSQAPDRAG
jgi:hypothetical protein